MRLIKLTRFICERPCHLFSEVQSIRCCSSAAVKGVNLNHRARPETVKSTKKSKSGKAHSLTTVLPKCHTNISPSITELDKQLSSLDELLKTINLKIAEQQEQLDAEDEEMQNRYGVSLPPQYLHMVGSVDPNCPPSRHPCVGCGAPIHCCSPHQPGFIPSAKFKTLNRVEIQNCKCLRCKGLEHHEELLDAQVGAEEYRNILATVKGQRSVILHVVDVTDYQNSTIPDLLDIVGREHPVYVIANKVDLLPKDSKHYLRHIERCITDYSREFYGPKLKGVMLTSALTGYGIEPLVTHLLKYGPGFGSNFHLVGCTNSGKSSLFNSLLTSDLCKEAARDKIARATISNWPGTTLNLLKFPVNRPKKYMLALRAQRLKSTNQMKEDTDEPKRRNISSTTLRGLVEPTLESLEDIEPEEVDMVASESDLKDLQPQYAAARSKFVREHNHKDKPSLDYKLFKQSRWLFDTPGLVSEDQIINNMTMVDLKRLLMRRKPLPRTYSLRQGMSMLIGGIGRIDILDTSDAAKAVHLTVVAAAGLPVTVVFTENVEKFYEECLANDQLVIPNKETDFEKFPELAGHTFEVHGVGYGESLTDVQLSSIGWVSVTYENMESVVLKAFTPGGAGCHVRPSLLPYAVQLKGQRIQGTRTFRRRKPL